MSSVELIAVPARRGKAARVRAGERVRVVNTHGTQVVESAIPSSRTGGGPSSP